MITNRAALVGFATACAALAFAPTEGNADGSPRRGSMDAGCCAIYNWTGFYVGGHAGGGWGESTPTVIDGSPSFPVGFVFTKQEPQGGLWGGQIGYNHQIGQFVFGIEGEHSWAKIRGTADTVSPFTGFISTSRAEIDHVSMLTGRIGYAQNNWLLYAKGGYATSHWDVVGPVRTPAGAILNNNVTEGNRNGWTVGGGVEYGISRNLSVKAEYDFIDLGTITTTALSTTPAGVTTPFRRSTESDLHLLKLGFNFRF